MSRLLVTGGAGFMGSNFIRYMLHKDPRVEITNLDLLTYAGNPENLADIASDSRYQFIQGDVADSKAVDAAMQGCQQVVHFAAESHVDRSIDDASAFMRTNIQGSYVLLEAARRQGIERFLMMSTDEVYGSYAEGLATEESPIQPNSPYSASKAAADHLARAYHVTYKVPTVTVRASNNYGPYQFPEKFLPVMISQVMQDKPLPIYGDGQYVREWLHVEDCCAGIALVLEKGALGEAYNVGSGEHHVNLDIAKTILKHFDKPESLLEHVEDRAGHDRRYAISADKLRALGWAPKYDFLQRGLPETIAWYQTHESWWKPLQKV